jgi:LysM repeat protein
MNTANPLLPQGSLPQKAKSNICFKILMILAIHVVVIGGLLLQGCSKDKATTTKETETATATNASPMSATPEFVPAPVAPNNTASAATATPAVSNAATTPAPAPVAGVLTTPVAPALPVAAPMASPGVAKDYVIASGDTLGAISKRNGVSIKALLDANPGIEPKKLQIGHKIQIPAGTAVASKSGAVSAPVPDSGTAMTDASAPAAGEAATYTVKAGDRLLKIASAHGTTVKAILALNDMKTTAIRTGQKLKLPVMKVASADMAPAVAPSATSGAPAGRAASPMPATTAN